LHERRENGCQALEIKENESFENALRRFKKQVEKTGNIVRDSKKGTL
jgi:ribosomal protein S21